MAQKTAAEIAAEKAEAEKAEAAAAEKAAKDPDLDRDVKAVVKTENERKTHAQKAREREAAEFARLEAESLEACETFVVVHPKMNIWVGPDLGADPDAKLIPEIEVSVGTERVHIDVVDGWATIPKNAQLRASTRKELDDFRLKVSLGFLTAIPAVPAAS